MQTIFEMTTIDLSNLSLINGKPFQQIYELSSEDCDDHINNLVTLIDELTNHKDKLILVTGSNGSGKSMLRQQISLRFRQDGLKTAYMSMEQRTSSNPNFGALSGIFQDTPWIATSSNSLHFLDGLLKNNENRFTIIDEPEIGMSQPMVKAVAQKLVDVFKTLNNGMMVISHNKHIVKKMLEQDNVVFVNLNGFTSKEFLESFETEETSFDLDLFSNYHLLFETFQKRLKK